MCVNIHTHRQPQTSESGGRAIFMQTLFGSFVGYHHPSQRITPPKWGSHKCLKPAKK